MQGRSKKVPHGMVADFWSLIFFFFLDGVEVYVIHVDNNLPLTIMMP